MILYNSFNTICSDFAIAKILMVMKNIVDILHIVVPILLIIYGSIMLAKMMANPDRKNGKKNIYNIFIAAVVVFFIPTFVNVFSSAISNDYGFNSCWHEVQDINNYLSTVPDTYYEIDDNKTKNSVFVDEDDYEKGKKKPTNNSKSSSSYTVSGNYSKDVETYMNSVKNVVREAREGNYHYGDSHATPPTTDGLISCDRLEAKALYDIGYTDQRDGGEVCSTLDSYLTSHGWIKSTNINDVKYGSIVLVSENGTAGPVYHAFTSGGYNPKTGVMIHYDEGAEWRIHSDQPFETTYYTQDLIYGVYNLK